MQNSREIICRTEMEEGKKGLDLSDENAGVLGPIYNNSKYIDF